MSASDPTAPVKQVGGAPPPSQRMPRSTRRERRDRLVPARLEPREPREPARENAAILAVFSPFGGSAGWSRDVSRRYSQGSKVSFETLLKAQRPKIENPARTRKGGGLASSSSRKAIAVRSFAKESSLRGAVL